MANIFSQILPGLFGAEARPFLGHRTQYADSNRSSGQIQLLVGFDIGTAFAELVVAERLRAYAEPLTGLEIQGSRDRKTVGDGRRVRVSVCIGRRRKHKKK